jgi:hypothetical protein
MKLYILTEHRKRCCRHIANTSSVRRNLMKEAAKEFWNWFERHHHAYIFLNDIDNETKERLMNAFLVELHKYCNKLYFEIGILSDDLRELVISAEGNIDYFENVESLINAAPVIRNWKYIAFIPPRELDFEMNYEGVLLRRGEIWFLPLENENDPAVIGIKVCIMNYELMKESE